MEKNLFVVISGNIGVGKTELVKKLNETIEGSIKFKEPVKQNIYLEDFYRDTEKYAFIMQVYLLNARFRQHKQIQKEIEKNHNIKIMYLQDRSIYEDTIFIDALLELDKIQLRDVKTYKDLFENMKESLKYPDVIVYLKTDPQICLERIKERGRECEKNILLEYLQKLQNHYDKLMNELSKYTRVIILDWTCFMDVSEVYKKIINID